MAAAGSILIVSGLKREATLAAGPDTSAAFGNASTLQARFAALADVPLRMVVSFGLCGGLDPKLRSGNVVLGSAVVARGECVATDEALTLALERRLTCRGCGE